MKNEEVVVEVKFVGLSSLVIMIITLVFHGKPIDVFHRKPMLFFLIPFSLHYYFSNMNRVTILNFMDCNTFFSSLNFFARGANTGLT